MRRLRVGDFSQRADRAVHSLDLVVAMRTRSSLGAAGHESHASDDEGDAEPAPEGDVFVEEELRQQHHQDVAERGGGQVRK